MHDVDPLIGDKLKAIGKGAEPGACVGGRCGSMGPCSKKNIEQRWPRASNSVRSDRRKVLTPPILQLLLASRMFIAMAPRHAQCRCLPTS